MNAWVGLIGGGVIGGVLGYTLTKSLLKRPDIGVTGAAMAAGALIGGAMTAPTPSTQQTSSSAAPTTPTG